MTKNSSRVKLIHSTQVLMLARGYSATGVDDICRDAGLSKGAFYHQFTSKEELAIAALASFYEAGLQKLLGIDVQGVAPERRLFAFLDVLSKQGQHFWKSGCLIGSVASEMAGTSPALQTEVSRLFTQTAKALEPLFEPFVASIETESLSASALAEQLLVVVEGAIVMSRAHADPKRINRAIARFSEQLRWLCRGLRTVKAPAKKAKRR